MRGEKPKKTNLEASTLIKCKKGTFVLVPFGSYFLKSNSARIERYLSILVFWR